MRRLPVAASRGLAAAVFLFGAAFTSSAPAAEQKILPSADGTLVDGGTHGLFDGVADTADWTFNESDYEGAVTLTRTPPPGVENRVVWEYSLATVTMPTPVMATLTFTLRGAPRYPAEPAEVEVYAYPADLLESLGDFSAGPAKLISSEIIEPFHPATAYVANVNDVVNAAIVSGTRRVAFRFQINPSSAEESNQAFFDALDSDLSTKPFLTLRNRIPSDYDDDRDIDLADHSVLAGCLHGPNVGVSVPCAFFDADLDGDVDLLDVCAFQKDLAQYSP